MAFLIAIRINVEEYYYFGHICTIYRLNFKRTVFAYQITATTMACSSLCYNYTMARSRSVVLVYRSLLQIFKVVLNNKLKKFRKISKVGCSVSVVQNWHLACAHTGIHSKKHKIKTH